MPGFETIGSCASQKMEAPNSDEGELIMKRSCEGTERRALKRNTVHNPAIAVVRAKPTIILGQIQDISAGGLSFTYMKNALQLDEASELEILLPGEKYYLNGLPFKTVSDSVVPKENPFSMITMSRRGVQFLHLTPLQMSQLWDLIHKVLLIRPGAPLSMNQYKGLTTPAMTRQPRRGKALLFDPVR